MRNLTYYCHSCRRETNECTPDFLCKSCGGVLVFSFESYDNKVSENHVGVWRFSDSFPLHNGCSLGEGMTPLLQARSSAITPHPGHVFLKYEASNPTGSFKDRGTALVVSAAEQLGYKNLVIASTGNAGASVAAYAARMGLRLVVLAPDWVSKEKLWQITCFGAEIRQIRGSFLDAEEQYRNMAREGWFPAGSDNPFRIEGTKTLAFEIAEQMPGGVDRVILPVGTGNLIVAAYKGFAELAMAGVISKIPIIDGVQLSSVPPLPLQRGTKVSKIPPKSVATGINIAKSLLAREATEAILRTKGTIYVVNDRHILSAQQDLACHEGVAAEPTGAVAVAAYRAAVQKGLIPAHEKVVLPITGHLLKQPAQARLGVAA